MIKHIILWKLKGELREEEKGAVKAEAKKRLESLNGKIAGLVSLVVETEGLPSSTADMMLDSVFTDVESYQAYRVDPLHQEAAGYVRSVVESRLCLDYQYAEER